MVMWHTLGVSLNIRHNLYPIKGPKPPQIIVVTTDIPNTCAFTLALSTSQRRPTFFFFLMIRPPPRSTLSPYTPLFRSGWEAVRGGSTAGEEFAEDPPPPLTMESTEDEIVRRMQVRASFALILERVRLEAVDGPVREQFEEDLKALTEAEQDPKELKSAKRQLLFSRIDEQVQLPFPVAPATSESDEPPAKDSITRQYIKKAAEAIYKDLVRRKIAVEKRRPDGRGSEDIREITCEVGVVPRPHGSALFTRGQTQ